MSTSYTKSGGLCLASIIIKIAQVSAQPKLGANMQVGDLVKLRREPDLDVCLGLVLDTTCVQANVHWFTSPSGDTFSSWVYFEAIDVVT